MTNYFKSWNAKYLILGSICAFILGSFTISERPNRELQHQQRVLAMRSIGNDLLAFHNDLNTPVPPVQSLDNSTYRLYFEQPLEIIPDTLVSISLRHLTESYADMSFISVLDSELDEVVYGFEINHSHNHIIPCLGRNLSCSDYWIDISFYQKSSLRSIQDYAVIWGTILSLALFLGFWFVPNREKNTDQSLNHQKELSLDLILNQLIYDSGLITLTDKEAQILDLLLKNQGELVSREQLVEEVWLKKGVMTGRSLDVYISRLRKKISVIPNAEIINLHGKGYIFKHDVSEV